MPRITDPVLREHIGRQREALGERARILREYLGECLRIRDFHGVQDAASDLRELEAAESALEWVLGERETLGY